MNVTNCVSFIINTWLDFDCAISKYCGQIFINRLYQQQFLGGKSDFI